jgi:hypothetical protein
MVEPMHDAYDETTTPSVVDVTEVKPLPPLYPPMTQLAGWLQEIYDSTATEIRDVILVLRRVSLNFQVLYSSGKDEMISGWPDWDVNWTTFRARRKKLESGIDYPLTVSWEAAERAVIQLRKKPEIKRLTPGSPESTAPAETPPYRTGTQGRPTSINLVAAELVRRQGAGQTLDTQAAEARALTAWLVHTHPEAPKIGDKAIRTNVTTSELLRAAVAEAKARKERRK